MTEKASEIKAGMSNPAKILLAYMRLTNRWDSRELAAEFDVPLRTIQRWKMECAASATDATNAIFGVKSEDGHNATRATDATDGAPLTPDMALAQDVHSCAGANIESFQDTPLKEIHTPPTPSSRIEANEGECEIAHGVLLNCQTIRHQAFTISLPAIELGVLASGLSKAQIKDHCLAHALQWAAEIEAGSRPEKVIPGKIANFLSASIMNGKVRSDVAEMRMGKAQRPALVKPKSRFMEALLRSEAVQ